jgi:hypothetical protein
MRRLRRRNHEWAEGWGGYEAYEENNEQGKLRCLLLRREKIFLYIFMMRLLQRKKKSAPPITTDILCGGMLFSIPRLSFCFYVVLM